MGKAISDGRITKPEKIFAKYEKGHPEAAKGLFGDL